MHRNVLVMDWTMDFIISLSLLGVGRLTLNESGRGGISTIQTLFLTVARAKMMNSFCVGFFFVFAGPLPPASIYLMFDVLRAIFINLALKPS